MRSFVESTLWNEFRIDLDKDGKVRKDANGMSRILIFGRYTDGREGWYDPASLGIDPVSTQFIREAEKGNVLVFPTGKENPVQLQAWTSDPNKDASHAFFSVTEALKPEQLVPPVKKMGWLRGLLRVITLGFAYRGLAREIAQQNRDYRQAKEQMSQRVERRKTILQKEVADVPKLEEEHRRREEQKLLDKEASDAKRIADIRTTGMENFVSILGPEPKSLDRLLKVYKDGKKLNPGAHTLDQFKDLTVFTKDADEKNAQQQKELEEEEKKNEGLPKEQQIHTKPYRYEKFDWQNVDIGSGQKLTKEIFASVGLLACFQPHIANLEYQNSSSYDPTFHETLIDSGFTEEQAYTITGYGARSMGTTDNFIEHGKAREDQGAQYKDYVNVGRLETAAAFKAYQNGDKGPLAKIIATGINKSVECLLTGGCGIRLDNDVIGTCEALKNIKVLLDNDPALRKELEDKKYGLDPQRMKTAQGMLRLNELDDQARKANKKLAAAMAKHDDLTPDKKKELTGKIIAARLSVMRLKLHYLKQVEEKGGAAKSVSEKFQVDIQPDRSKKPRSEWKKLEPFRVDAEGLANFEMGVAACFSPMPGIALELANPKMEEQLEKLSGKIVDDLKLSEKSPKELFMMLEKGQGAVSLTKAMEKALDDMQAQNAGPVRQEQNKEPELDAQRKQSVGQPKENEKKSEPGMGLGVRQ